MVAERVGAAKWRRDRQLRAFRRHELLTVQMELAAALQRSAQRVEGPSEGEVHEKHDGLRAQKRPLPGTRPAPVAEVAGPQVRADTVGYVAAVRPQLVGHRLKGDDGIDGTAVRFLVRKVLEEKERRQVEEKEKAAHTSASAPKRTRKKRRKRKLPRNSSCPRLAARHLGR